MTVKLNKKEAWLTGTIVQIGTEEISIEKDDLKFYIRFIENSAITPKIDIVEVTEKSVKFQLTGFDNALGTAYQTDVGQISGENLHMRVCVHAIGDSYPKSRVFNYTFVVG